MNHATLARLASTGCTYPQVKSVPPVRLERTLADFESAASTGWATGAAPFRLRAARRHRYVRRGNTAWAPATRSRKSLPLQWSISCWRARASKASVVMVTCSRRTRELTGDGEPGGALDVAGEVRDRHAAFAAFSLRVASTTSALHRTNMPWQVRVFGCWSRRAEHLRRDPHLRRRQPDTARRHPHRRDQVGRELNHSGRAAPRCALGSQDRVRCTAPPQYAPGRPSRHAQPSRVTARRSPAAQVTPMPSSSRYHQPRLQIVHVDGMRDLDLRDQHVQVTAQPRRQVGDVPARRRPSSG